MAPLLAIGYASLATMAASALVGFGVMDGMVPAAYVGAAREVAAVVLLISYVVIWLWMLIDHVVNGESEHSVLIAIAFVLGGGLTALAYFFLVFHPRHATPSHG